MAKAKGILPKNGGTPAPMDYKEPTMPERVTIEKAKNGFTVRCSGGKDGYNDQPHIAKDITEAMAIAAKHFGGKAAKDEEDDG